MNIAINPDNQPRRKRILLGVTGSVAAIKGPEIALLLSKELDAHVVVLLTHGGANFWYKAKEYNRKVWEEYKSCESYDHEYSKRERGGGREEDHEADSSLPSLPGDKEDRCTMLFSE